MAHDTGWLRRSTLARSRVQFRSAAALSATIVGLAVAHHRGLLVSRPAALSILVEAVGGRRLFEARLTGGFEYGPLGDEKGTTANPRQDSVLFEVAAGLRARAEKEPTFENRRALAAAHLITRQPGGVAVEILESLAHEKPGDAGLRSDLAAAFLVGSADRPNGLPRALEEASRALETDSHLPEALHNRALALEEMGLTNQARKAWAAAALQTSATAWSIEAERRARDEGLAHPSRDVTTSPYGVLEAHLMDSTSEDSEWLQGVSAAVQQVRDHAHDPTIEGLARVPPGLATAEWRRLHLAYALARKHYASLDWQRAQAGFRTFAKNARGTSSPLIPWAAAYEAIVETRIGDRPAARRRLARLAGMDHAPALTGRCRWTLGLMGTEEGRFADALREYALAQRAFQSGRDRQSELSTQALVADVLYRLGRSSHAWNAVVPVLQQLPNVDPLRVPTILMRSAEMAIQQGWVRTGLALAEEARARLQSSVPEEAAQIEWTLARVHARAGRGGLAARHLEQALGCVIRSANPAVSARLWPELALVRAELGAEGVAVPAMPPGAAERFRNTGEHGREALLRIATGASLEREGLGPAALEEFTAAVDLLEQAKRPHEASWVLSAPVVEVAFSRLIAHAFDSGALWDALALIERMTSFRQGRQVRSISGSVLREQVSLWSDPTPVTVYFPLRERLLVFRVGPGSVVGRSVPVPAAELEGAAAELEYTIRNGPAGTGGRWAKDLSGWLLSSAELDVLTRGGLVLVAAFGVSGKVPFAALEGPGFRAPQVIRVPSLLPEELAHAPKTVSVSAVAPALLGDDLAPLPAAVEEARVVAAAYSNADLVLDNEATLSAMKDAFDKSDILHFAGHGSFNGAHPEASSLWLSDGAGGAAAMPISALAGRAGSLRLAFLSACSSARASGEHGETMSSIAEQLLQRSVDAVVGFRWDVDDREALWFASAFHAAYAKSLSIERALQETRAALLTGSQGRAEAAWSAAVVFQKKASITRAGSVAHNQEK